MIPPENSSPRMFLPISRLGLQVTQVAQFLDFLERLQIGNLAAELVEFRPDLPAEFGLGAGRHRAGLAQRASSPR